MTFWAAPLSQRGKETALWKESQESFVRSSAWPSFSSPWPRQLWAAIRKRRSLSTFPAERLPAHLRLSHQRLLKRKMSTEHQVLLHSDQGVQYSSAGYCNPLKEYNVIQSMSRAGNPRDNAVMESFWGRFKDTLRKHFRYWECDDLRSTIEQAIYYFNNERPVRKLKGKPPVPYRTELVA